MDSTRTVAVLGTCFALCLTACLDRTLGTVGQTTDDTGTVQDTTAPDTGSDANGPLDISPHNDTDDTRGDAVQDTAVDVIVTRPGCPPMTATPSVLVQEEYWQLQPKSIAAKDGVVYFGATQSESPDKTGAPSGSIFRISAGGGPYEELAIGHTYLGSQLAINQRHLAYYQHALETTGSGSWSTSTAGVVLRDLVTGEETLVGGAAQGWGHIRDFELLADSRVSVVFSSSPYLDGPVGKVIVFSPEDGSYDETTYGDFRWMTGHGERTATFEYVDGTGVTLGGDAADELQVLDVDEEFQCCRLMAADERGIYQRRYDTIERLPWDGSPAQVLAIDVEVEWRYARHGNMLYWVQHDEVWALNTEGGTASSIAKTQSGYIDYLAADRCGVYFSANSYPRLMAMAAPGSP